MKYKVAIRRNDIDKVRIRNALCWDENPNPLIWVRKNLGCDCQREIEFQRAFNEPISKNPLCGSTRYSVLYIESEDGRQIVIDDMY